MESLSSYFIPWSSEHHALEEFRNLSGDKKFLTIMTTLFATILTLPFLGIGGVVAFRAFVERFTFLDLTDERKRSQVNPEMAAALEKTQKKYLDSMNEFMQKQNQQTLLDLYPKESQEPLEYQRDTFFEVAGKQLNKSKHDVLKQMRAFIQEQPITLETYYFKEEHRILKDSHLSLDSFKDLMISQHTAQDLKKLFPYYDLSALVDIQKEINYARCQILAEVFGVQVIAHDIILHHNEGIEDKIGERYPVAYNPFMVLNPIKKIEIAFGNIQEIDARGQEQPKYHNIFVQPRLVAAAA